jgi:hypothetical protein
MKLFKILAVVVLAMVSSVSAEAGVVLSNLGPSGTDASLVSQTNTNQSSTARNFTGFTVGSSAQTLQSINVGLFQVSPPDTVSTTLELYSSVGGLPGSLIATSAVGQCAFPFTRPVTVIFLSVISWHQRFVHLLLVLMSKTI